MIAYTPAPLHTHKDMCTLRKLIDEYTLSTAKRPLFAPPTREIDMETRSGKENRLKLVS